MTEIVVKIGTWFLDAYFVNDRMLLCISVVYEGGIILFSK